VTHKMLTTLQFLPILKAVWRASSKCF
jgi:hypothetical protein